ncbi:substrate-binding periplasmic protein [Marinobacter fonticola]|uniref:substrate-binding periplasmic protein n=1 Tax=Marinobacter fonticola TaxID=2603215 RepID=UPI0011E68419|nr:transporter substrate-binding domain-containing protein [Marinobacter fonticola]
MIQRHIVLLLTLFFALPTSATLSAQTLPETAGHDHSVLRLNVATGGYPPYTIIDEGGAVSGIMWDVMSAIAKAHNLALDAREIPTKRVDDFLLSGQLDATMRALEWSTQPEQFVFSDSVLKVQDVIFTQADNPLQVNEIEDLAGGTLLARFGYHYPTLEPYFDTGEITRLNVPDAQSMFQRLHSADRFDGLVSDLRSGRWLIQVHGWDDKFKVEPLIIDETDFRFMFAPEWAPFVEGFNQTLQAMRESGEFDAIVAKY